MVSPPVTSAPIIAESLSYRIKRRLLGPPMVSEQLAGERLTNPIAMGVLSCDMISSSAYGTEEMLTVLVPVAGLAAWTLVMPVTFAILGVLIIVTLSYREVVMVYTKAGGSYVVARDNFGLNVAQFAAVALLIDYTLTVAVQVAAGTDALTSAIPSLNHETLTVAICVTVVVLLIWGNLRGIREAGRTFAFPTYFFIASMGLVVLVGLTKASLGDLHDDRSQAWPRADRARGRGTARGCRAVLPAPRFRQRWLVAHRARGHLQQRLGVPSARRAQRPQGPRHHRARPWAPWCWGCRYLLTSPTPSPTRAVPRP